MSGRRRLVAAVLVALALPAPAAAQDCLTTDPPEPAVPPHALRFGITPQEAGRLTGQGEIPPLDTTTAVAALTRLRPPARELVMRLNRLFWADGDAGIAAFAARARAYGGGGFPSEVQVRYHPPEGSEGDIAGWVAYVRKAVTALAGEPSVVAVSITNEGNLPISPNTSDGAYDGVVSALVEGVPAAREAAIRAGRPDIEVGFTVMWRWNPDTDAQFWTDIGAKATPAFRSALDYVGMQVYPGLVWPPAPLPGRTAGEEVVEALALVRDCYMPKAALDRKVDLWVSENGYPTNLGRSEATQVADLESTLRDVHRHSGALGVTDYRYFNLRDNDSTGTDLFDAVGLLRDDLSDKPAFATLRALAAELGTAPAAPRVAGAVPARRIKPRLTLRGSARGRRLQVRGRLLRGPGVSARACRGRVTISARGRGRGATRRTDGVVVRGTVALARSCRYSARLRLPARPPRRLRLDARFAGNEVLLPAAVELTVRRR